VYFQVTFAGVSVIPANASPGTGQFSGTLDTAANTLAYFLSVSSMTSPVTSVHIHGPAAADLNAGILATLWFAQGPTSVPGNINGHSLDTLRVQTSASFTPTINGDSLQALLVAGLLYVDVHTSGSPQGEVRAQLVKHVGSGLFGRPGGS